MKKNEVEMNDKLLLFLTIGWSVYGIIILSFLFATLIGTQKPNVQLILVFVIIIVIVVVTVLALMFIEKRWINIISVVLYTTIMPIIFMVLVGGMFGSKIQGTIDFWVILVTSGVPYIFLFILIIRELIIKRHKFLMRIELAISFSISILTCVFVFALLSGIDNFDKMMALLLGMPLTLNFIIQGIMKYKNITWEGIEEDK